MLDGFVHCHPKHHIGQNLHLSPQYCYILSYVSMVDTNLQEGEETKSEEGEEETKSEEGGEETKSDEGGEETKRDKAGIFE